MACRPRHKKALSLQDSAVRPQSTADMRSVTPGRVPDGRTGTGPCRCVVTLTRAAPGKTWAWAWTWLTLRAVDVHWHVARTRRNRFRSRQGVMGTMLRSGLGLWGEVSSKSSVSTNIVILIAERRHVSDERPTLCTIAFRSKCSTDTQHCGEQRIVAPSCLVRPSPSRRLSMALNPAGFWIKVGICMQSFLTILTCPRCSFGTLRCSIKLVRTRSRATPSGETE